MDINKSISVVIPVYNEEENIILVYQEIREVFSGTENNYEIIFVDDGSNDKSGVAIKELVKQDSRVRGIILKRNYGQTAAIVAGIECSQGDFIITMDADLQNDPKDIISLINKINEGYDLVSGWRKKRKDAFFTRKLPSLIANYIISNITGLKLHDYGCTLKIYKRDFLKHINLYGEMHRFIPVYVYWMGGKIAEIQVNHRMRKMGISKYRINRTFKVILDLITVRFLMGPYSTSPLYFFGRWSFLLIILGILAGILTLIEKLAWGVWVHRNPLMLLSIFFIIIGTQFVFMGLLAEINIRTYYETTHKAIYMVEEKINC